MDVNCHTAIDCDTALHLAVTVSVCVCVCVCINGVCVYVCVHACRAAKSPAFAGDLPVFVFLGAYLPSSRLDTSISRICMAYLQRFSLQLS